jgi:hypothetical protein
VGKCRAVGLHMSLAKFQPKTSYYSLHMFVYGCDVEKSMHYFFYLPYYRPRGLEGEVKE